MKYRAEIDGLRAIAIVPVILFHAGFEVLGGGFLGVDIFFVISGYLITSILIGELKENHFTFSGFYERRARRILPALLFVLFCCLPFAWIWMQPGELSEFAGNSIAVTFFISNFFFWHDTGYFEPSSELNPLLHMWSLSVEEQFYLIFPVFLLLAWRRDKHMVFRLVLLLGLISLFYSQIASQMYPSANFYLLPSRAWELLAGALAALTIEQRGVRANNVFSLLGLILVILSIFLFDKTWPSPGLLSLVPVGGTVLLILYADQGTLAARILQARPLVMTGLISYSAYLWHQPLFAFARVAMLNSPSETLMLALSLLTLILAGLTWRFVEQPFRHGPTFSKHNFVTVISVVSAALVVFSSMGVVSEGFAKTRFTDRELEILNQVSNRSDSFARIGSDHAVPTWMILGDSHANTMLEALDTRMKANHEAALVKTINGCPPALNLRRIDLDHGVRCHRKALAVLDDIDKHNISNVLISARFPLYLTSERFDNRQGGQETSNTDHVIYDHLDFRDQLRPPGVRYAAVQSGILEFLRKLSDRNIAIYIIPHIPEVGWNVPKAAWHLNGTNQDVKTLKSSYLSRAASVESLVSKLASMPGVKLLDASGAFCDANICLATEKGIPLYFDSHHLNRIGATRLVDFIYPQMVDYSGVAETSIIESQ